NSSIKTGITVSITSSQDRALVTYLGSIAELRASDVRDEYLRLCNHLHVSSFFLQQGLRPGLKALLARARQNGLTTSLDPGFDPQQAWERDLIETLQEVDVFLPNEVELEALTRERNPTKALQSLDNGHTLTVAKLGRDGCMVMQNGTVVSVPAFPVEP